VATQIFFIFTRVWGKIPILTNIFSKGLVQPPTSILVETSMGFPTENLRVSWEPRSRDGHRHLVTWGKYTPLKIDSYSFSLGGCFFGFQPYFFREFCFRWWIMANPANQSKLSPFVFYPTKLRWFLLLAPSPQSTRVVGKFLGTSASDAERRGDEGTVRCPGTDVRING